MSEEVTAIRFGAMVPPLAEQLEGQAYNAMEICHCQTLADAVTTLFLSNILTETEVKAARKRLGKRIFRALL